MNYYDSSGADKSFPHEPRVRDCLRYRLNEKDGAIAPSWVTRRVASAQSWAARATSSGSNTTSSFPLSFVSIFETISFRCPECAT